jgi:hypothetical protein
VRIKQVTAPGCGPYLTCVQGREGATAGAEEPLQELPTHISAVSGNSSPSRAATAPCDGPWRIALTYTSRVVQSTLLQEALVPRELAGRGLYQALEKIRSQGLEYDQVGFDISSGQPPGDRRVS